MRGTEIAYPSDSDFSTAAEMTPGIFNSQEKK